MNPNSTRSIFEFLLELSQESARELINIYHSNKRTTSLRIPDIDGKLRISEQEFRFMMTSLIEKMTPPEITFTVEHPTEELYSFSGGKAKNAWTDLSFFYDGKKVLNIEFKAEPAGPSVINKDIEKLCREPVHGAWCHIFEDLAQKSPDKTIKRLFEKFTEAIPQYFHPLRTQPISFHILILEKRSRILLSRKGDPSDWIQFRKIHKQGDDEISKKWLNQKIFNLDYDKWASLPEGYHTTINNWIIDKY